MLSQRAFFFFMYQQKILEDIKKIWCGLWRADLYFPKVWCFPPCAKLERQRAGTQPNGLLRKAQMIMLLCYVNTIRETYINIDSMNRVKMISDCTLKLVQACKYNLHFIAWELWDKNQNFLVKKNQSTWSGWIKGVT